MKRTALALVVVVGLLAGCTSLTAENGTRDDPVNAEELDNPPADVQTFYVEANGTTYLCLYTSHSGGHAAETGLSCDPLEET